MRALIQRVERASVEVDGSEVGSCGEGYLVLLGVGPNDDENVTRCADENGRTNLSLVDVGGSLLVVSQFTLYADARHGNRPSFTNAAPAELANRLYELFCELAEKDLGPGRVGRGEFGAHMRVGLINDGPFTVMLDSEELGL